MTLSAPLQPGKRIYAQDTCNGIMGLVFIVQLPVVAPLLMPGMPLLLALIFGVPPACFRAGRCV